jgi:hypothetical protein
MMASESGTRAALVDSPRKRWILLLAPAARLAMGESKFQSSFEAGEKLTSDEALRLSS